MEALIKFVKGQAKFVSYIFTILISIVIAGIVIAFVYSLYNLLGEDEIRRELRAVALQGSSQIVDLITLAKNSKLIPENNTSILISEVEMNLPAKAANKKYELLLISPSPLFVSLENITIEGVEVAQSLKVVATPKIIARTTEEPITEVEIDLPNLGVILIGKAAGESAKLKYYRHNFNNAIRDFVLLGDSKILITIERVE
jgi:hypothetical protein